MIEGRFTPTHERVFVGGQMWCETGCARGRYARTHNTATTTHIATTGSHNTATTTHTTTTGSQHTTTTTTHHYHTNTFVV